MSQSGMYHHPPITFTYCERIKFFLTDVKFHKILWMAVIVLYGLLLAWTVEGNDEDSNKTTTQGQNTYRGYRWTVRVIIIGSAFVTIVFELIGFNVRFDHPFASINLLFQTALGYCVWACGVLSLVYLVLQQQQIELWEIYKDMSPERRAQFTLILLSMFIIGVGQISRMYRQHFDSIKAATGTDEWRDEDENVGERMWWGCMAAFGHKREWKIERIRREREMMYKERSGFNGPIHNTIQPYQSSDGPYTASLGTVPNTNPTYTSEMYNTGEAQINPGGVSAL
jgi:succinate dehydrogenase hydrophobic anchor subunit